MVAQRTVHAGLFKIGDRFAHAHLAVFEIAKDMGSIGNEDLRRLGLQLAAVFQVDGAPGFIQQGIHFRVGIAAVGAHRIAGVHDAVRTIQVGITAQDIHFHTALFDVFCMGAPFHRLGRAVNADGLQLCRNDDRQVFAVGVIVAYLQGKAEFFPVFFTDAVRALDPAFFIQDPLCFFRVVLNTHGLEPLFVATRPFIRNGAVCALCQLDTGIIFKNSRHGAIHIHRHAQRPADLRVGEQFILAVEAYPTV